MACRVPAYGLPPPARSRSRKKIPPALKSAIGLRQQRCLNIYPFLAKWEKFGGHHAESPDRIHVIESRHPGGGFLDHPWGLAECMGILGPVAGDKPDHADCRCLGRSVQGHA